MKVICDRGALVEALNLVGGVVVTRTPKPVLTCVKLAADNGTLTLTATDLEASIREYRLLASADPAHSTERKGNLKQLGALRHRRRLPGAMNA